MRASLRVMMVRGGGMAMMPRRRLTVIVWGSMEWRYDAVGMAERCVRGVERRVLRWVCWEGVLML